MEKEKDYTVKFDNIPEITVKWDVLPTCRVMLYGPDCEPWERELFEKKQSELSWENFSSWLDGYNFYKHSIDISDFKPPYGIAKFGKDKNKTVLLNKEILGVDYEKGVNSFGYAYQLRKNVVYIQASSEINLGSGVFSGWCVLEETSNLDGSYTSYSFHTRLRGDRSKLNIENLL